MTTTSTLLSIQAHRAQCSLYDTPGASALLYQLPASGMDRASRTMTPGTESSTSLANIVCPIISPTPVKSGKPSKKTRVQGSKRTRAEISQENNFMNTIGANLLFTVSKKPKVSRAPRVEKRKPDWTESKMHAQFYDAKGNFMWLKDPALRDLAEQSGWSLTAIKSVRTAASQDKKHRSRHGPEGGISPAQYEQTHALCGTDAYNLSRPQLLTEMLKIRFHNHVNKRGHGVKYKPPGVTTQYSMLKRVELLERATNSCQTEARDLAHRCPYTYISAATNFLAMELMYGAPIEAVKTTSMRLTVNDLQALDASPAQAAASGERVTRPENVIYWDESCGRTFSVAFKAMKPRGTKHVKGLAGQNGAGTKERPTTKALKQQFKFVWGCTAAGNQLPCLIGLKSEKMKEGEFEVQQLTAFTSIANSSIPPLLVVYNGKTRTFSWSFIASSSWTRT